MNCHCKTPCGSCRCGMAEGERRKADALAVLLETDAATADDVRALVELPADVNPKVFGAVPSALARLGIIRADGFAKTCRPTAHARPLTLWTLADRAAAERWLAAHPELPDPVDDQATDRQGTLFDFQETATPTGTAAGAAL